MEPCTVLPYSPEGCIVVLSGLPGSGKTTLANEIVGHLGNISTFDHCIALHICYDKILSSDIERTLIESDEQDDGLCTAVTLNDQATSQWKLYRQSIVCCVDQLQSAFRDQTLPLQPENIDEKLWQTFLHSLCSSDVLGTFIAKKSPHCYILIIDDNMYYRSMRYTYYQLARKYHIGYCQIHSDCTLSTALRQNRLRTESISDDVITEMNKKFEPPDGENYPWETYSYSHDSGQTLNVAAIVAMVTNAINDPVKPTVGPDPAQVEESRRICSESVAHQVDQILRKLVKGHILKAKDEMTNKDTLRKYASELNNIKAQLLSDLKQGLVGLPIDDTDNVEKDSKNVESKLYKFTEEIFQTRLDTTSTS